MKSILKSIAIILTVGFFFSSCKNSYDVVKRHHTGGYYIAKHKKVDAPKSNETLASIVTKENKTAIENIVKNDVAIDEITENNNNLKAVISEKNTQEITKKQSTHKAVYEQKSRKENLNRKDYSQILKMGKELNKVSKSNKNSSEGDDIILIICCLFIPPLAVYIHQGEVNSKFWIDLLLTFLFFLPGMIYAFIVCFA
jgi:uncharacterized membrane protein YqaE (UPF0057 family)